MPKGKLISQLTLVEETADYKKWDLTRKKRTSTLYTRVDDKPVSLRTHLQEGFFSYSSTGSSMSIVGRDKSEVLPPPKRVPDHTKLIAMALVALLCLLYLFS